MQAHQIHQLLNTGMGNPETQVQHTWAPQRVWFRPQGSFYTIFAAGISHTKLSMNLQATSFGVTGYITYLSFL